MTVALNGSVGEFVTALVGLLQSLITGLADLFSGLFGVIHVAT
jgi:hypothetical protein